MFTPVPSTSTARALGRASLAVVMLGWTAACTTPQAPSGTIDREAFISTYVELRVAALAAEEPMLSDSARSRVLAEQGVSEADLMAFVEAHGEDVELMNEVWDEVEVRLDTLQGDPDSR